MDLSNKQNMLDLTWRQLERRAGPADFDPTQDTRDYEQVAQSARAYQTLTGNLLRQETIHCEGFVTHEDTEAPPPKIQPRSCIMSSTGPRRVPGLEKTRAPPPPFFFLLSFARSRRRSSFATRSAWARARARALGHGQRVKQATRTFGGAKGYSRIIGSNVWRPWMSRHVDVLEGGGAHVVHYV